MNIFPKTISDKIVYHKEYTYCDPIFGKYITKLSYPDVWESEFTYDSISFNKNFSVFLNNIKNKTFIKYLNTVSN